MDAQIKTIWQFSGKSKVQDVLERMKLILRHNAIVIASCREAQARRRIQLYFDDRLIDEFEKAGKRIAKRDVKD